MYVMNGMVREATQELGGWKSPAVTEGVYTKARPGEVVPEMLSAVARACNASDVTSFFEVLVRGVGPGGYDALGLVQV